MDSKAVNKSIRTEIHPLLKEVGFTRFTGRSAWRYAGARIDVVNFQSFNSYNAEILGCTTYSFAVNLGCYDTTIPCHYGQDQIKRKAGELRPDESQCPFRGRLRRNIRQLELEAHDIWYIDPAGRYLEKALHDVRMVLVRDGLPWFERLAEPSEALRILLEEDEQMGELWGFGRNPSPIRHYLSGYLALNLGHTDTARQHLEAALASGCFGDAADQIRRDLERAA